MKPTTSPDHEVRDGLSTGRVKGRGAGLNPGNRFESTRLHVSGDYLEALAAEQEAERGEGVESFDAPMSFCSSSGLPLLSGGGRGEVSESFSTAVSSERPGVVSDLPPTPSLKEGEKEQRAPRELALVQLQTRVLDDESRAVINAVNSPDLAMKWTVNPYRGCEHGCIYCYARPGHEYLGHSLGVEFESIIYAKREAPALLREELCKPSWQGEPIVFSGVTDCYQPLERELEITRSCLKVCSEFNQPVSIITKNKLVTRDLDILGPMARRGLAMVAISITSLDNALAAKMEPRASSPRERLAAVRELSRAGVPVCVMMAPIIPGLNDREIPQVLRAVKDAGAVTAGWVMLRLPYQIKDLFLEWLYRQFPDRAAHIEHLIRDVRGGGLYDARHGIRQRGQGPVAEGIARMFRVFKRRCGLDRPMPVLDSRLFRRTHDAGGQAFLFGGGESPSQALTGARESQEMLFGTPPDAAGPDSLDFLNEEAGEIPLSARKAGNPVPKE